MLQNVIFDIFSYFHYFLLSFPKNHAVPFLSLVPNAMVKNIGTGQTFHNGVALFEYQLLEDILMLYICDLSFSLWLPYFMLHFGGSLH